MGDFNQQMEGLNLKKTGIKIIVRVLIIICILFGVFYFSGINDTPRYPDKTVFDIRNYTGQTLSGGYLSVDVSESYHMPEGETYYEGRIEIPEIKPYERIIFVLDQNAIALPGMYLRFTYEPYDYSEVISDIYGETGTMRIIEFKNNNTIKVNGVVNHITEKHLKFSIIPYSKVIEYPSDNKLE